MTSCFIYKVSRDLKSIDHLYINPIRMIGNDRINTQVIYRFALAQGSVQGNNCKQNITSLSLLAGRTVDRVTRLLIV